MRKLVDQRLRKAESGFVKAEVARTEAVFLETVKRQAVVKDECRAHRSDVVEYRRMIDPFERLLPVLAGAGEDAVVVAVLRAVVLGVAAEDPVFGADVLVDLEHPIVEVVAGDVVCDEEVALSITAVARLRVRLGLE